LIVVGEVQKRTNYPIEEVLDILRLLQEKRLIRFEKDEKFVVFRNNFKPIPIDLDHNLYEEVKEIVGSNDSFPNIHKFVDTAVRNYIRNLKYNIEGGVEAVIKKDGTLKKSERVLTMCISCWKPFLKMRNNDKESGKICPNCRINIIFFSKMLEDDDPKVKELRENISFVDNSEEFLKSIRRNV
jgi:DNA-directed RNA polymerase subunit RPC12/RpoP